MKALHVEAVQPDFVARVTGIDLREPLGPERVDEIEQIVGQYGVLIFPGQPLSQEELVRFGESFGELNTGLQKNVMKQKQERLSHDAISDISNLDEQGAIAAPDHWMSEMNIGNRMWHSDASYEHRPWKYSVLSCVRAASRGGETQFADLRAAYDDLDEDLRKLIEDRVAIFFARLPRLQLGFKDKGEIMAMYPPTRWPMIRTHPISGRKVIWCDTKVAAIEGLRLPEARSVIMDLIEHIGQREHVYSHRWKDADLIMYDNRSVLHRGRRFDLSEPREMRRIAVIGDDVSLGEAPLEAVLPS